MISTMTNNTDTKAKKAKNPKRTQDFKGMYIFFNAW